MRRGLAVLCALSVAAAACGRDEPSSPQGEIRIGATIEISGEASKLGAAHRNALNLMVEKINRRGVLGKRIKLIIRDNRTDPKEALAQAKELISDDDVVAVIGGGTTPTSLPIADLAEQEKVPLISMGSSDEIVNPPAKRRYTFKTPANPQPVVEVMISEFEATGAKRIAALAVGDKYGDSGVQALRTGVARAGLDLVGVERFAPGDTDYTVHVTKLMAAKPDAIVVWSIMPGAGIAAKNIDEAGFKNRVYFDPGAGAELFLVDAGDRGEGKFMVHPTVLAANQIPATTPSALAQKEFFTEYTQKYGTFSGFASYSADALSLLAEALKEAGSTDRQRIRDALEKLSYDGLTGSYTFSATNHGGVSGDALALLTVRSGGWVIAQ